MPDELLDVVNDDDVVTGQQISNDLHNREIHTDARFPWMLNQMDHLK
jgi:hypothetical protein